MPGNLPAFYSVLIRYRSLNMDIHGLFPGIYSGGVHNLDVFSAIIRKIVETETDRQIMAVFRYHNVIFP